MKLIKINDNLFVNPEQVTAILTVHERGYSTPLDTAKVRTGVRIGMHGQCFFVENCKTEKLAQKKVAQIVTLLEGKK